MIACCLIGSTVGVMIGTGPLQTLLLRGGCIGGTLGISIWWGSLTGLPGNHLKTPNIFYEDNVSKEEIERF
jgi:hypothetical protein